VALLKTIASGHNDAMRVLLATCRELPEPDPDDRLLVNVLEQRGITARYAAWDDPGEHWEADLVVLRSTWNYYLNPVQFLEWAESVGRAARLVNPLDVIFWNHDKRYLLELERSGVPIVPTRRLERGQEAALDRVMHSQHWQDVVIKPAISAASYRTRRFDDRSVEEGNEHLSGLLKSGDALVQEYMPAVESHGERSLVWIDGTFTHAVRKSPRLAGGAEDVSEAVAIDTQERKVGEAALASIDPGKLLYARVDVVPDSSGQPRVMELELIEPSLFFLQCLPAVERFADGILARLKR
jgi:glutathione synthase/RimK-type ligase-like ATP-grasp enzyme